MAKKIYVSPSDQNANSYATGNTNEMVQCQKISVALVAALKRCGFEAMTNLTDEMEERVDQSNSWGADLHLPIHTNAFNTQVQGTRLFCWEIGGEGDKICQAIMKTLAPITPGTSDSVTAYPTLYEVKNANAPTAYIEVAFHDNKVESDWIIKNIEPIAEAICEGICNYYGYTYKKAGETGSTTTKEDGKYASKVLQIAFDEVGYLEKASNSNLNSDTGNAGYNNYTKYARDLDALGYFYNGAKNGYAWCDVFVDWCFVQAFGVTEAMALLNQPRYSCGAGCYYSAQYFKNKGQFHKQPKVGDQIFFYDSAYDDPAHTGLVYAVDNAYVYTIEGNTSSASGVVANGGGVFKKKYAKSYDKIYGYGRPLYDDEPSDNTGTGSSGSSATTKPSTPVPTPTKPYKPTVLEWQKAAIADGYKFPKYGADGEWGSECEAVAKKAIVKKRVIYTNKNLTKIVQKVVGAEADGKCGKDTEAAIKKYQAANRLKADGQVGINTWKKMLGV